MAESASASQLRRILSWRSRVPAAEARKAEGASDDTRLTPRPPCLTGRLALIYWISVRSVLVMLLTQSWSSPSNFSSAACPLQGDDRMVCSSFGALNDAFNRTSASCAAMEPSLADALARSSQRRDKAVSMAVPAVSGAPSSSASSVRMWAKFRNVRHVDTADLLTNSHCLSLSTRPISSPLRRMTSTS